jgi:monothiol glutaredoxin
MATKRAPSVRPLTAAQLFELREGKRRTPFFLVDVRTDNERRNIPFDGAQSIEEPEDEARIAALPKKSRLVFICYRGIRSLAAAKRFAELGFTDVLSLDGGVEAYVREYGYASAAAE